VIRHSLKSELRPISDKATNAVSIAEEQRGRLLRTLAAATFLIFFQAYMVAPLIPGLSHSFGVSEQFIGLIVPAYMIPYGLSTLLFGLLSDRLGRRRIMIGSLAVFIVLTLITATSRSATEMLAWRLLTGLGAAGVGSPCTKRFCCEGRVVSASPTLILIANQETTQRCRAVAPSS